jgi:chromosome partitioning protein
MIHYMKVITLTNLKGGSAKTTSTAFLAHAYVTSGKNVLVIDTDPQGQSLRWSEQAGWGIPTLGLPVKDLHKRLPGIVPPSTDIVFIDTPPLEEQAGIVYAALRSADVIVVTMAPTMAELDRLPDVWATIEEINPLRDTPPVAAVLLNRTITNANSTGIIRAAIENDGHIVLGTTIPRRESIAQAYGAPVTDLGKYADVAKEIDRLGAEK